MSDDAESILFLTSSNWAMSIVPIVIFILLLILSAAFSATETAFSSINEIRLKQLLKSDNPRTVRKARLVLDMIKDYGSIISTVLVGNNIVNLTISSLMTYALTVTFAYGESGVWMSTMIASVLIIIFGEILPKNLAKIFSIRYALFIAPFFNVFMLILRPITFFFSKLNDRIEDKMTDDNDKVTATESELLDIVETIEKEGVLEQTESEIIQSAITFDDILVETIMIPREKVITISANQSFMDLVKLFAESKFSRIPVLSAENPDIVVGIVRQQAVFDALADPSKHSCRISDLMSEPLYITHLRILPYALEKLQRNRAHLAIVVDSLKNSKFLGIVSLEDILEEIVGEIYDEYDVVPEDVIEIGHHIFEVSGSVTLEHLFENYLTESDFPKTKIITVGAWVKNLAGHRIVIGNSLHYDNLLIRIIDGDDTTVKRVEIHQYTKTEEEE